MRNLRTAVCLLASCLLATACGGSRPSIDDFKPAPDLLEAEVRALVERCAVPDLEELFGLLDVFEALLDPDIQDPPLVFTGLRIIQGCIDWNLDSDGDAVTDVSGSFCFKDASGAAVFPFNPINLGNGVAEVADLLARLPDGTTVVVAFSQGAEGTGALTVRFDQGRAQTGSGTVQYTREGCTTSYGFTDILVQNLLTPLPNALVTLSLDAPEGVVFGTLSMNGTRGAVLSMTRDERVIVYSLDLETFAVRGFQDPLE